jgi:hypothetical protein
VAGWACRPGWVVGRVGEDGVEPELGHPYPFLTSKSR